MSDLHPELAFLGYQRVFPTQAIADVLGAALERFIEKFNRPADICLLSVGDAQTVGLVEGIDLLPRTWMPAGVVYVGAKESVR